MSKSSEYVKTWRKNTKNRMVQAMGGKCVICGYDRCVEAMDFHHLDPSQKDFNLGKKRANAISWSSIITEIKKCVLLCATCHREVHVGIATVPAIIPKFNPVFEDYKALAKEGHTNPCPICGQPKRKELINCSLKCSGIAHRRVNWEEFDILEMSKTMTKTAIAEIVGVSDVAVYKHMKKWLLPLDSNQPISE